MNTRPRFHRSAVIGTASLLTALLLLAGCGQKGPLYLPEDDNPSAQEAEQEPAGDNADE
ncbi:LPS translocon maturation chaperone LptM [Marinimicrobium sp. C2-29]|uniref:LPS translocon maturation chaperone LptM n=1 Tax=Marinimicrobium sp. C2-29 TaxID=3139825 RepID=UPI0040534C1F